MQSKVAMYSTSVLYNLSKQTGGIKRFLELAEYACQLDPRCVLYSQDDEEVVRNHGVRNFIKLKPAVKKPALFSPEIRLLIANRSLIKDIKKSNYDKVVIFDVPSAIGPILLGLNNVVLMIRKDMIGYEIIENGGTNISLKIIFQWFCEAICLFKSKTLVCQCNYDKEILKGRHILLKRMIERKTKIQINNVNPTWVNSAPKIAFEDDGQLFFHNESVFKVCFIGGFDNPRKGQDLFLDSALELISENRDIQFILIGGGFHLEEYKKKFMRDQITFTGRKRNPIPILKSCDLLVVPSFADSCPNTVMEAIYNGIAVIGSNAGGIPEILANPQSIFNLASHSISEKILLYKNDRTALNRLREQQTERKHQLTFDWSKKIIEIIDNC